MDCRRGDTASIGALTLWLRAVQRLVKVGLHILPLMPILEACGVELRCVLGEAFFRPDCPA